MLMERTTVAALITSQCSLYTLVLEWQILFNLFNAAVALCKYLGGIRSSPVKAWVFLGLSFVPFLSTQLTCRIDSLSLTNTLCRG